MLYRAKRNGSTQPGHPAKDRVQKTHRYLAWIFGTATGALIINVMAVVALVDTG
jgi:hypothetical protein